MAENVDEPTPNNPQDRVVVARRVDDDTSAADLARWCGGEVIYEAGMECIKVPTSHGIAIARRGDWIVRDNKGKFARVTRDEFAARFEPAETDPPG
jgi:hypothetical protein